MTSMLRHTRASRLAGLVVLLLALGPSAAERRPIADDDLFSFVWIADPQMSPDGTRLAFVRVTADKQTDQYTSAIWLVATDGRDTPRQLTAGGRDLAPRWSPDSRWLAFLRAVEKEGRPQPPQIYLMSMAGGEPRAITDIPRGAASAAWSPDGTTLAFTSGARPDELPSGDTGTRAGVASKPRQSDVRVITEAVYRANGVAGSGYVDSDRPAQVWTVALPDGGAPPPSPRRMTSGPFSANNPQWSADGSEILFVSDRRRESYYYPRDSDLYAVSKTGGEPRRVASIDGVIGDYAFSHDGKRLAFIGSAQGTPERSYNQPDLWVMDLPSGAPRNLTASYDFDIGGSLAGDQRSPRGQLSAPLIWSEDDRLIFFRTGRQGEAPIVAIEVATGRTDLYSGHVKESPHEAVAYTADRRATRFAVLRSTPTAIGDLYFLDGETGGPPKKLTSFNDSLFSQIALSEPEEMWYSSFDGRKIQSWIVKPPDFDPGKKYPLIVQIHGGPHSAYGATFTHEFVWMAAKGYVVLYTNPRGSSNYGQEFGNVIQYKYPGDDYKDIMAGVDALLKKGYIDESRMGVTGGSGGGLLTNWVVTQTTRFKAAVSQRDISDWSNFWYTADFTLFTPTWFRKAPFEDPAEFAKRSPVTYVANIRTPMMFILGDEDWRTPPSAGGEELFRALKYLKRDVVMVRFPGESHELSRSGRPWHRVERLQHIVGWFDKHLNGKNTGTYDGAGR